MPTNYVEINRDEMEYVDGGASASVSKTWYGSKVKVYLNSTEANKLAIGGSALFGMIGAWTFVVPIVSAVMWTVSIAFGGYIGWLNADGSGVVVEYNYISGSSKPSWYIVYDR